MTRRPILLVEDNPQDEALILRALKKANLANEIAVARDGQQALDYLFRRDAFAGLSEVTLPGLIMLDLNLPKLSGLEVLAQIRAHQATALLPVVILTSSDEERDLLAAYRGGANSFVRKPLDFGEFARAVAQLGLYWAALNLLPDAKQ